MIFRNSKLITNLLGGVTWEQGTISSVDGTTTVRTDRIRTVNYVSISAATPYAFSLMDSSYSFVGVFWYQSNNTFISGNTSITNPGIVTSPALAAKAKIVFKKADSVTIIPSEAATSKPQVEIGRTAHRFVYNVGRIWM